MKNKEDKPDKTVKIKNADDDYLEAVFQTISAKMVTNDRKQVSKKSIMSQFNQTIQEQIDMRGGTAIHTPIGRIEFTSDEVKSELSK